MRSHAPAKSPVFITTPEELAAMRKAGRLVADAHAAVRDAIRPGVTPLELDRIAERVIAQGGGRSAFKGVRGYHYTICASPNDSVVHGLPNRRKLDEGDVIAIDIGAEFGGHFADSAWTHPVGVVSAEAARLLSVTAASLEAGIAAARAGVTIEVVSGAIEDVVTPSGFGLIRDYVGHGIGRVLHGSPEVPNYRVGRPGPVLRVGQGLAIEPMVNAGTAGVYTGRDGWTVKTRDGGYSAHFEHTLIVTEGEAEVTTRLQ
jgi:methionyl aminopeptidase